MNLESLGLNSSSVQSLRADKRGTYFGVAPSSARPVPYLPMHTVPSRPKEAVLLPLGSYSSNHLLVKVY